MDEHHWTDKETGWYVWVGNGVPFYSLNSPDRGEVKISFIEKLRMRLLINWWASGALQVAKRTHS